jgi:dTDP-4-dehydrorhamnose reductase
VSGTFAQRRPSDLPEEAVARLDKADPASIREALGRLRPEAIVDTGALHHVDYCETHPEEADGVNGTGTAHVAAEAARLGARLLFVSTDYVFDGTVGRPYRESDPVSPINVYGATKVAGERATLAASERNLVVRSSVIVSWVPADVRAATGSGKGINFATWALEELRAGRPLRIVDDQIGSPTLADDLAAAIVRLLERGATGTYHAAGATPIDRFAFTRRLARRFGLEEDLVRPIRTSELRQAARRPHDSSLNSGRLREGTGYRMGDLDALLDQLHASWSAPA